MSVFQLPLLSMQSSSHVPVSLTTTFFSDSLRSKLSVLSLHSQPRESLIIRMGGGPRTYPGGVSKWQWKRMQAKKAKQLLKARLCRERQIYEMRKRAELKAAVSELERPWEVVERAPTLFSVKADEQLKVLADRFQRPGGFDMWSEKDGPQLFEPVDGLPSTRFFPKGVVHSIKPYAKFSDSDEDLVGDGVGEEISAYDGGSNRRTRRQLKGGLSGEDEGDNVGSDSSLKLAVNHVEGKSRGSSCSKDRKKPSRRKDRSLSQDGARAEQIGAESIQREINSGTGQRRIDYGSERRRESEHINPGRPHEGRRVVSNDQNEFRRSNGSRKPVKSKSDVYDMSLKQDGSYGF
ncbi:unnamed protein product [Rhodiola kirilowii]